MHTEVQNERKERLNQSLCPLTMYTVKISMESQPVINPKEGNPPWDLDPGLVYHRFPGLDILPASTGLQHTTQFGTGAASAPAMMFSVTIFSLDVLREIKFGSIRLGSSATNFKPMQYRPVAFKGCSGNIKLALACPLCRRCDLETFL